MANRVSPPAENVRACERNRTAWITTGHTMPRLPAPDAPGKLRKSTVLPDLKFRRRIKFRMVKVASYVNFGPQMKRRCETFSGEFGEHRLWLPFSVREMFSFLVVALYEDSIMSRRYYRETQRYPFCKKVKELVKSIIGIPVNKNLFEHIKPGIIYPQGDKYILYARTSV
jgi:hypothetical protein